MSHKLLLILTLTGYSSAENICPNQERVCDRPGECCSKFGFCGTGDEWCRETWNFNETACPECVCDESPTPEPTGPFEENCNCICYGDPHCKMWNCAVNSWQGPHFVDPINVYYMTRCNGYTIDDMPFDLIGVNQRYDEYFTSLNYTILKLYGPEGAEVCIKNKGNEGVSYNTDCGNIYDTQTEQNEIITVGIFFEMLWYFENGYSKLFVRNKMKECEDTNSDYDLTIITMTATDKEESVQISVSDCYKQYTCGMCGDFYHTDLNFQTADGTVITLDSGAWGGTANDETGLSYAVEVEEGPLTTPIPQRRLLEDTSENAIIGEPCHGLKDEIESQCDIQMEPYAECCWDRLDWCKNYIKVACGWDSCACVSGNSKNETQARYENTIDICIRKVLNASMSFTCGLNASHFNSPDMSKYGGNTNNESECKDCDVTGNIFIGIFIGCVIFGIIVAILYCLVIKPKLQQKMVTGTGEAMYQQM